MTSIDRAFRFEHALSRIPGNSVSNGLRSGGGRGPDPELFRRQHRRYVEGIESLGVEVQLLSALEEFPDSVFIEDAAICIDDVAVLMRPGAPSRRGETSAIRPDLERLFKTVIELPGPGTIDGGDVLLTNDEALIGLSDRTNKAGFNSLAGVLGDLGYRCRQVHSPAEVLHFKSDCGLLDAETILATRRLAATGCFANYRVMESPTGEEAAANLIRVNDAVIVREGFPRTADLLREAGYDLVVINSDEAATVDGGLSCMSLRY